MSVCSQNPNGLSGPPAIIFSPSPICAPSRLIARVMLEVPLRCIPKIQTAVAVGSTGFTRFNSPHQPVMLLVELHAERFFQPQHPPVFFLSPCQLVAGI